MKINELNEAGAPHLPAIRKPTPVSTHVTPPRTIDPNVIDVKAKEKFPAQTTPANTGLGDIGNVRPGEGKPKVDLKAQNAAAAEKGPRGRGSTAGLVGLAGLAGLGGLLGGRGTQPPTTQPATTTVPNVAPPAPKPNRPQANLNYKGSEGAQSLMALNPDKIKNVNKIRAGDTIDLGGGNMYKIQKGDTLDKIAQRMTRQDGQQRAELDRPDSVLPGPSAEKPPITNWIEPPTIEPEPAPAPVARPDYHDPVYNAPPVNTGHQGGSTIQGANLGGQVPDQTDAATVEPTPAPVKGTPENPYDKGPEVKSTTSGETWKDREGNAIRTRSDAEIGDTNPRTGVVTPGSYDKNRAQGEKNLQGLKNFFGIKEELNMLRKYAGMQELNEAGMPAYMQRPAPTATNATSLRTAQNAAGSQTGTSTPGMAGAGRGVVNPPRPTQVAGAGRGFVNPTAPKPTTMAATTTKPAQPAGPPVGSQAQTASGANELAKVGIMGGNPATTAPSTAMNASSLRTAQNAAGSQTGTTTGTASAPNLQAQPTQAATTSGSPMAGVKTSMPTTTQAATTSGSPMAGVKTAATTGSNNLFPGRQTTDPNAADYDADLAGFEADVADMKGQAPAPNQGGPETTAMKNFESRLRESNMELNILRKYSGLPETELAEDTVHKGTYGTSYGKEDVRDQYGHKIGRVDKGADAKKEQPKRGRGRPTKGDKDEHGHSTKFDTSGLQGMLGGKPKGEVGKKSVKHSLKDWIESVSDSMINEAEEEKTMSRAAKGHEKYGKEGMQALAKAGRDGASEKKLDTIRNKYDKYDKVEEAKDLPGNQDELDVAKPKGKLTKADFEKLRNKKKVSEARVMEESEYTYEKIGKILAQEKPTLDSNSDEFVNAVYDEMIQMGMTPKSAKHKLSFDEDFLSDVATSYGHYLQHGMVDEVAGAGRGSVNPPAVNPSAPTPPARTASPGWGKDDYKPLIPDTSTGPFKKAVVDPEGVKEAGSFIRNLASSRRAFEGKDMKDVQLESWEKELNSLLNENITVSTTIDDQGHDSVSVSATEGDAHEIMELLRNAGIGAMGHKKDSSPEVNNYGLPMSDEHEGPQAQLIAVDDPHAHDDMGGDENGDDMLALIKKMTGIEVGGEEGHEEGGQDYEHEEGGEEHHEPEHDEEDSDENDSDKEEVDEADMEEGNMFTGNLAKARAQGKKEADLDGDGDMEKVQEDDMEEGNMFTGNLAKARAQGKSEADLDGDGDMEKVHEGEDTCNECGMYESECGCDHEAVEENFANSDDDKAYQDIQYMMRTLSGGGGMGEKRSQATGPILKVTMEDKLMKESTDLLVDFKKLSGI